MKLMNVLRLVSLRILNVYFFKIPTPGEKHQKFLVSSDLFRWILMYLSSRENSFYVTDTYGKQFLLDLYLSEQRISAVNNSPQLAYLTSSILPFSNGDSFVQICLRFIQWCIGPESKGLEVFTWACLPPYSMPTWRCIFYPYIGDLYSSFLPLNHSSTSFQIPMSWSRTTHRKIFKFYLPTWIIFFKLLNLGKGKGKSTLIY